MSVIELIFAPQNWPFGSALVILIGITVLEAMGLAVGASVSDWIDNSLFDWHVPNWLGWLHLGEVPSLILLVLFLTGFSLGGYGLQSLCYGLFGFTLPTLLAVIVASFTGIFTLKVFGHSLARLRISDQSSAVSELSFIGRVAVITEGLAKKGMAAQAKLQDEYKNTHYVLVEPDIDGQSFAEGSSVLLVKKVGARYFAIVNPHPQQLN